MTARRGPRRKRDEHVHVFVLVIVQTTNRLERRCACGQPLATLGSS